MNANWVVNAAGFQHSLVFGFGIMDAEAFFVRAQDWRTVPAQIVQEMTPPDNVQ